MLTTINYKDMLTDRNTNITLPSLRDLESPITPPNYLIAQDSENFEPDAPELVPLDLPPEIEKSSKQYQNLKRLWENKDFGGVFTDYKPKLIEILINEEELNEKDPEAMQILSNITQLKHEIRELNILIDNSKHYLETNQLALGHWDEIGYILERNLRGMNKQIKQWNDELKNLKKRKKNLISTKRREVKAEEIYVRIKVQLGELETYNQRNNVTAAEYLVSIHAIEENLKLIHKMGLKAKKGTKSKLEKYKRILDGMRKTNKMVDEELKDLLNQSFNSQSDDVELDAQNDLEMEDKDPSQPPPKKKIKIDVFHLHHEVQPAD